MQKSGGGSGNGGYSTFLVIPIATTAQLPGFYFRFVKRVAVVAVVVVK